MLAELVAVVTGQQHDRVSVQTELLQLGQHPADLRVNERGRRQVGPARLPRVGDARRLEDKHVVVGPQRGPGDIRQVFPARLVERRQRDGVHAHDLDQYVG